MPIWRRKAATKAEGLEYPSDAASDVVLQFLPFHEGSNFLNFISLSLLGIATSIFTTAPGMPAVLTPPAPELALPTGFSTDTVLMTQVIGFSTIQFSCQVGPLIVAMGLAGESTRPLLKITLSLFVITVLILLPIDFLWWKVLGAI